MRRKIAGISIAFLAAVTVSAQSSADRTAIPDPKHPAQPAPARNVSEKWNFFVKETFTPMTSAAGAFNGALSQITNSDPKYGLGAGPYAERFGASTADVVTQNFFGDFLMASVFHEDTRYVRRGQTYGGIRKRAVYAVSRAFLTQADSGGTTFNGSNWTGTPITAGVSNLYYPPASRTAGATATHFGTGVIGGGLANLFP